MARHTKKSTPAPAPEAFSEERWNHLVELICARASSTFLKGGRKFESDTVRKGKQMEASIRCMHVADGVKPSKEDWDEAETVLKHLTALAFNSPRFENKAGVYTERWDIDGVQAIMFMAATGIDKRTIILSSIPGDAERIIEQLRNKCSHISSATNTLTV